MVGYWPISFFVFMDRDEVEVHKNAKRTRTISSHLDQTSLVNKDGQKNFAFAGPTRGIPSGQDRPILPARVANQNTGFASSCPLAEPAI